MTTQSPSVLLIGSGPNAVEARDIDRAEYTHIVAINNAWRVRDDWDISIFPEDFPAANQPRVGPDQRRVGAAEYVPIQNDFGGFVYAGGTMAFTAGYWALGALKPAKMAFIGCDMVYPTQGQTHFYGTGTADPLRADVTLQSLEAKSARLAVLAAREGCMCLNLSRTESRLLFPREATFAPPEPITLTAALAREAELGYMVPSGRYWEEAARFDAGALRDLDAMWLAAHAASWRLRA